MAIYRLLKDTTFEPEAVEVMGRAYEDLLADLRLADCNDPFTEIVAKEIGKIASRGVRSARNTCAGLDRARKVSRGLIRGPAGERRKRYGQCQRPLRASSRILFSCLNWNSTFCNPCLLKCGMCGHERTLSRTAVGLMNCALSPKGLLADISCWAMGGARSWLF